MAKNSNLCYPIDFIFLNLSFDIPFTPAVTKLHCIFQIITLANEPWMQFQSKVVTVKSHDNTINSCVYLGDAINLYLESFFSICSLPCVSKIVAFTVKNIDNIFFCMFSWLPIGLLNPSKLRHEC